MKVLQIDLQENLTQYEGITNKLTRELLKYEGITNQQIKLNTRRALQIGQQLKPSNNEDIAWKKMGKKKPHPHFQIENEDGVQGLDQDFLFVMCCITFF